MIILLFSVLWGGLLTLILCSPYGYYPLFYGILAASIVMYLIAKKHFRITRKYFYALSLGLFLLSYTLCTYIIFKPANFHYSDTVEISQGKKAVIFYCEGEMEKYTPYYASYFLQDTPLLLKPFSSLKIKQNYRQMGVNTKNSDLVKTASDIKNSLLNYRPYYFYIAFSGYVPGLKDSIHSAITDGCGDITIINYSADYSLENKKWVREVIEDINTDKIKINFTKPVHSSAKFLEIYPSLVKNLPVNYDGILIMDEANDTSRGIKGELISCGYEESKILIENNISKAMGYFKEKGLKNIFYINLSDSSSGLDVQIRQSREITKYAGDFKIMGKESWGYDKRLVKAAVDIFLEAEKQK